MLRVEVLRRPGLCQVIGVVLPSRRHLLVVALGSFGLFVVVRFST